MKNMYKYPIILASAMLLGVPQAHAALQSLESFPIGGSDYNTGSLVDQNPSSPYFTTAWEGTLGSTRMSGGGDNLDPEPQTSGTFAPGDLGVISNGLSQSGVSSSGGAVRIGTFLDSAGDPGGEAINHRALTDTNTGISDGQFLWFSGLIQAPDSALASGSSLLAGYNNNSYGGGFRGMSVGFADDQVTVGGRGFETGGSTSFNITGIQTFTPGETYYFIAKLGLNDGGGGHGGAGNDEFKIWLNPSDISSESALGTATAAFATYSFQNQNDITRFSLRAMTAAGETSESDLRASTFDEFRLGTDLESVAVIPEPGTLALVGIALGSLLLFYRRRR